MESEIEEEYSWLIWVVKGVYLALLSAFVIYSNLLLPKVNTLVNAAQHGTTKLCIFQFFHRKVVYGAFHARRLSMYILYLVLYKIKG